MKKLKYSLLLAATVFAANVYAGGPSVEPMQAQKPSLFASVEGGYTWNYVGNTTVNYINTDGTTFTGSPSKSNSGGSGRLALGVIHYSPSNPDLSYTGELGWGYYGKTTFSTASNIINSKNYTYGVDLLAGVDYQFTPMFDGFFKLGALFQNVRLVRNLNLNSIGVSVIDNQTSTVSSVIPEIKLGGIYNLTEAWGISLAYMHAFGNSPAVTVSKTVTGGSVVASSISSTEAPISLDNVMLGLIYKFA